jgi:YVTN family beta-propeller protein
LAKAHGIAVVPALQLAFVTNSGDNTVAVIDLRTQSIVDRIRVAENPDALLFDSRTGLIYVVNGTAKLATLIDPKARSVVATIALGGEGESPVLDPRTGFLYQSIGNTVRLSWWTSQAKRSWNAGQSAAALIRQG